MKKFLILLVLPINFFTSQESSYCAHRYGALQAYPNPFSPKYPRIDKLEKTLRKETNKTFQDAISIALFAATLDALNETKLSEFKDLLEKELSEKKLFEKKTIHHRVDFLIAQALWEDKFTRNGRSYLAQGTKDESPKSSFFYKDLKTKIVHLICLKKHNPSRYINELSTLLKIDEKQTMDTNEKCYTALALMLSPVKIEDINL